MTNEILGRPIRGSVQPTRDAEVEQWGAEKFMELLDDLLDEPNVEAVRWRQYTPYFNDGEPCIFGVGEFKVKLGKGQKSTYMLTDDDDEEDDDEDSADWLDLYDVQRYDQEQRRYVVKAEHLSIGPKLTDLGESSSHFEDFLGATFGDHATITATKAGFDIAEYDHE